jgi:uncharacterized protein (TIGR02271 family)
MAQEHVIVLIDDERIDGTIEAISSPRAGSQSEGEVLVQLVDGRQLCVPVTALRRHENGTIMVDANRDNPQAQQGFSPAHAGESVVAPVIVEELDVRKHTVETGRVRITKVVREREELVDEPLLREDVLIERVPINRYVEAPIPLRYEGDTMIISLLKEVPVIEKRLMLTEELRITRRSAEHRESLPVTLRSEEVIVERLDSQTVNEHENNSLI